MAADGKQLEAVVAFVEEALVPHGFTVTTNRKVVNDDGIQIAEFDVEVRGRVGSTDIAWLIECRDRPSQGAAPGSWIEQLVGRRDRFGFNKVTAVSTTRFAPGAEEFAKSRGIETRVVAAVEPAHFAKWIEFSTFRFVRPVVSLPHARVLISPEEPEALQQAAEALFAQNPAPLLYRVIDDRPVEIRQAFMAVLNSQPQLLQNLEPDATQPLNLRAQYSGDDHYYLQTGAGHVRVQAIHFNGEVVARIYEVPMLASTEYRDSHTGAPIAQVLTFAPQDIAGMNFSLELHHLAESGETHILLRRVLGTA